MPTGINQFQLIERVLIETDDACHGTHALRERAELPLQHFKKKIRARSVVLEPPGEIRRSSPARRDSSFLNRPVRYDVLLPAPEHLLSAQPSIYKRQA